MSNFEYDVQLANNLVEDICIPDSFFDRIYPFTTENISGYIDSFDLKDKTLLTVGSSCDQAINAFVSDAKEVTILDKNHFVRYYYFLKLAAINILNREEFLDFLKYRDHPKVFKYNYKVFNKDVYNRLKLELRKLDYLSYMFWDELFCLYEPLDIRNRLFNDDEERTDVIRYLDKYLRDDETYLETRNKLYKNKPSFVEDDVMAPLISNTYDNIWLSNITSYQQKYEDILLIVRNMYKHLNEGGQMQIGYLYDRVKNETYNKEWQIIYNVNYIFELLKDYNPEELFFQGIKGITRDLAGYGSDFDNYDSIITCKKLKK
jgi:hypothetical protein